MGYLLMGLVSVLLLSPLGAQSRHFELFDPNVRDNTVIVSAFNPSISGSGYNTLIRGGVPGSSLETLTLYPEKSWFFPVRNELVVYNHYGLFSYDLGSRRWREIPIPQAFSKGSPISPLSLPPIEMSPNGRFYTYLEEKTNDGLATILLYDRDNKRSTIVSTKVRREYAQSMVKWSRDSRYFLYSKEQDVYYFSVDQYQVGRIPAEGYRETGIRNIESVQWAEGGYFFILRDQALYRVHGDDLFTGAFYSNPFRQGVVWASLPVSYDPAFDNFRVSRRGDFLFFLKNGQDGMVFPLFSAREDQGRGEVLETPTLYPSGNATISDYQWLVDDTLLLLVQERMGDKKSRVLAYSGREGGNFKTLAEGDIRGLAVAWERGEYSLIRKNSVDYFSTEGTSPSWSFSQKGARVVHWGRNRFISLGEGTIWELTMTGTDPRLVGLTQVEESGYGLEGRIYARNKDGWFRYEDEWQWSPIPDTPRLAPPSQSTFAYRVYLEERRLGWYKNTLKIRSKDDLFTRDFIPLYNEAPYMDFVSLEDSSPYPANPWYFEQGAYAGVKQVALVFNGIDSADGVHVVLDQLERYKVQGTFFLNGDFIRTNPVETRWIAESGHTVGSLFYTWFDLENENYYLDTEFFIKGLARNEDYYYRSTGKDMALLWHTPGYYLSDEVMEASENTGYIFIGNRVPIKDRMGPGDSPRFDAMKAAEELLTQMLPGTVIPITLGSSLYQDEYLFQMLPMIIESLTRMGYEFVPLAEMVKARQM